MPASAPVVVINQSQSILKKVKERVNRAVFNLPSSHFSIADVFSFCYGYTSGKLVVGRSSSLLFTSNVWKWHNHLVNKI